VVGVFGGNNVLHLCVSLLAQFAEVVSQRLPASMVLAGNFPCFGISEVVVAFYTQVEDF